MSKRVWTKLRAHALGKPGATEHHPWGHTAIKVKAKVFVFLSGPDEPLSLSVKLPASGPIALLLPFAEPTGYGLGKAGWISASFETEKPNAEMLCAWIDESYAAIAPKKLLAQLSGVPASKRSSSPRRSKSAMSS